MLTLITALAFAAYVIAGQIARKRTHSRRYEHMLNRMLELEVRP